MKRYDVHPLAEHAPQLSEDAYAELREDIGKHGQKLPIVIFEDKILDGRHRERVCYERELKPIYEQFKGSFDDARAFVWSLNGVRRQLTAGQKASLAAGLATATVGGVHGNSAAGGDESKTVAQVSKETGVSKASIERAKRVQKEAPKLAKQVAKGDKTVRTAEAQVKEIKAGETTEEKAVKAPKAKPVKKNKADMSKVTAKGSSAVTHYAVTIEQLMEISSCSLAEVKKWLSVHKVKVA
jgi:hypothetical protein